MAKPIYQNCQIFVMLVHVTCYIIGYIIAAVTMDFVMLILLTSKMADVILMYIVKNNTIYIRKGVKTS